MRVKWGEKVAVVRARGERLAKEAGLGAVDAQYHGALEVWHAARRWAARAAGASTLEVDSREVPLGDWEKVRALRWKGIEKHAAMIEAKVAQESARREVSNARAKMKSVQ